MPDRSNTPMGAGAKNHPWQNSTQMCPRTGSRRLGLHGPPLPACPGPRNVFRWLGGLPGCLQGLTSPLAGHHQDPIGRSCHLAVGRSCSLPARLAGFGLISATICHSLPVPGAAGTGLARCDHQLSKGPAVPSSSREEALSPSCLPWSLEIDLRT